MLKRDVYKTREINGEPIRQGYNFMVQEKYARSKKEPLHKYLHSILIKGVPEHFSKIGLPSVSSDKSFIAVDYKTGERIYKENSPAEAEGQAVYPYPNCSHIISQLCHDSQGFVNKDELSESGVVPFGDAMYQHQRVQNYFMYQGLAEATEIPVWDNEHTITGFIDLIIVWGKEIWIWDYKPQADRAKNKHAVAQLRKYRELLHERLKKFDPSFDIARIHCGYFDEEFTYELIF